MISEAYREGVEGGIDISRKLRNVVSLLHTPDVTRDCLRPLKDLDQYPIIIRRDGEWGYVLRELIEKLGQDYVEGFLNGFAGPLSIENVDRRFI